MLAQDQIELLTAYVDGELNPRQRQAALRLVNESSEARRILMELQENAHRIQQLPRHTLDAVFTAELVQVVATQPIAAALPVRSAARAIRWLPYAAAGLAASVLILVGAAAIVSLAFGFGWFAIENGDKALVKIEGNEIAPIDPKPAPPANDLDKSPPPRKLPNPLPGNIMAGVVEQFTAPIPPQRGVDLTFQQLNDSDGSKRLAAEIAKNPALHLDVFVRNNPHAIERLKKALQPLGVKLVVDPTSDAALKKGGKVEFLVYAENLKPDELTKLLKQLAAEEKKTASPYDRMKVSPLATQEREQLVALLGEDPDKRNVANDKGIIGPKVKPNPKAERVVIVLPQNVDAKRSDELKQFLLQPARPQPGSVRVLVRIRQE